MSGDSLGHAVTVKTFGHESKSKNLPLNFCRTIISVPLIKNLFVISRKTATQDCSLKNNRLEELHKVFLHFKLSKKATKACLADI